MREIGDELQESCNIILDDDSVLEEDKIEQVEELVQQAHPDSKDDLERMVLDILWRHRDSDSRIRLSNNDSRIVERKPSAIVKTVETPLPSDLSKLEPKRELPSNDSTTTETPEWEDWDSSNAMSPFDILRQVLGEENSDEDIEHALERNNYDIETTLSLLMDPDQHRRRQLVSSDESGIGGGDGGEDSDDIAEKTICKYFLQFQECLRADCKYSHDLSSRICRFWLQGSCLAGESCAFLHYLPEPMVEKLTISNEPKEQQPPKPVKLTEEDFPTLGQVKQKPKKSTPPPMPSSQFTFNPSRSFSFVPGGTPPPPVVPVPAPPPAAPPQISKKLNRKVIKITMPKMVPWMVMEFGENQKYVSHRNAASRHAELRNKYLQLAAGSWHQNNSAQARLLSAKGQKHNDQMIDEYFSGSDLLYEQRKLPDSEIYMDLHGMELEESIERLEEALNQTETDEKDSPRPVYAICGIGHHYARKSSLEDKLSKTVKDYLDKWGYEWDEFKTKEPRFGKIIGIDPWSHI